MTRIFIVDDERPVVDGIALIVGRDLGGEFSVVGSASNGREALEQVPAAAPDIVLMDVRMPGVSGLETIRELRSRGVSSAFVLVTAYERFDIAREAVELGVVDYLLKPVSREVLGKTLRTAAAWAARVREADTREVAHRERESLLAGFAETALLQGLVLGVADVSDRESLMKALGIEGRVAVLAVLSFGALSGSVDPVRERSILHERVRDFLRYRSHALLGPLLAGLSPALMPGRDEEEAERRAREMVDGLRESFRDEFKDQRLRVGLSSPLQVGNLETAWAEAIAELERNFARTDGERDSAKFFPDNDFLEATISGAEERAAAALEALLPSPGQAISPHQRGRLASLFGQAARQLAQQGLLAENAALAFMDFGDLFAAADAGALALAVRARFSTLMAAGREAPRLSPPLSRAVAWIRENYRNQIGLELAAEIAGVSAGRLSRLFVEETGRGFSDWLIEYRIGMAQKLLLEPGASIKEVSASCGYQDPNYFARLFKKVTGTTPSFWAEGRRPQA